MNESARSIPSYSAAHARREQAGAAVGAVHVEPQPALRADRRRRPRGRRRCRRSSRRRWPPPRTDPSPPSASRRRRSAGPGQPPALVARHVEDVRRPSRARPRPPTSGRSRRRRTASARAAAPVARPPRGAPPPAPTGCPAEPPEHEHAAGVRRACPPRSRATRRAWFSAQIAPAPSIQPAAIVEDAPTIRSNSTLAFVGRARDERQRRRDGRSRSWPARAPRPRRGAPPPSRSPRA